MIFSCDFIGEYLARYMFPPFFLFHTHSYLNHFGLLITNALVNGWLAVVTNTPRGLRTCFIAAHIGAKGMTLSHEQAVVP